MNRADYYTHRKALRAWSANPANKAGSWENVSARGRIYRDAVPYPFLRDFSERDLAALNSRPMWHGWSRSYRLPPGPKAAAFFRKGGMDLNKRVALRKAIAACNAYDQERAAA